jgi:hypothetical protein
MQGRTLKTTDDLVGQVRKLRSIAKASGRGEDAVSIA